MRGVEIVSDRPQHPHLQLHVFGWVTKPSSGYKRSYKEKNVNRAYDIIKTLDVSFFHKLIYL